MQPAGSIAPGTPLGFSQRNLASFLDALAPLRPVFDDPSINEIMVNGPHDIFIRQSGPDTKLEVPLTDGQIRTAIQLLASMADKVVDKSSLVLSARLPGFRVEAALPPVAVKGPSMCIRRHATKILKLEDYIASGTITPAQANVIRSTVAQRKNFLIAGGTYSGKTTLMNCILSLIQPEHRLFVIEQVQELKIASPNHVLIECDPEQGVTARRAVMMGMRYSPDRIILGELRGQEAFDWMDASNTGHPGSAATIHADGASDALGRLESLVMMANTGIPFEVVQTRIASTVDVIFFIQQKNGVRRMSQICEITGFDRASGEYILKTTHGESHDAETA
ncbi:MAG: ATPase, T2SS/T4P/T4SS family [Burkholderiaceae bacterium]|nr:ATPase, T2SS/T4P/T4SS family [Burkholderiaceae bacterium]MDP3139480.1 ATPase, T2SS/T4P/T4SS family [Burkholderiaceae bacterium]